MGQSPFLTSIREHMLVRGYSRRTIDAYLYWIKRFILFHKKAILVSWTVFSQGPLTLIRE